MNVHMVNFFMGGENYGLEMFWGMEGHMFLFHVALTPCWAVIWDYWKKQLNKAHL